MIDPFYGNATDAKDYWSARGYSVPADASDDEVVNEWLLIGSEWIDGRFRSAFTGFKVGLREQIREFPRIGMLDIYGYNVDSGSIPREIIAATYEAALKVGQGVRLTVDYTPGKYKSVRIEGAISVDYSSLSVEEIQTQFAIIGYILSPLISLGNQSASSLCGNSVRV